MENLKVKLYNAILTIFDESFTEYSGLDDEEFMEKICQSVGMTEIEYKKLMLINNFNDGINFNYDFDELCPHCDYVNKVVLSDVKKQKNGKEVFTCQGCGKTILACNLCDCIDCGNCCVEEE